MAEALLQAIQRDFAKGAQSFGEVLRAVLLLSLCVSQPCPSAFSPVGHRMHRSQGAPPLTASQIIHIAQLHLKGVVLYQQELGNALAVANREGEDARREERMRIWGYC